MSFHTHKRGQSWAEVDSSLVVCFGTLVFGSRCPHSFSRYGYYAQMNTPYQLSVSPTTYAVG